MRAASEFSNLLETAEYSHWANDTKNHPEATLGFDYYKVKFIVGGHVFEGLVNIANSENGRIFYDITKIKEIPDTSGKYATLVAQSTSAFGDLTNDSIPAKTPNVNSKFSVSEHPGPLPVILPGGEDVSARDSLPAKARSYLERVERAMLNGAGEALGVSQFANRESLANMVRELSTEYLERGKVSQETTDRLFDQAYEAGIVADTAFYDQYRELKNHLRGQAVTIADQDKADIADFNSFRKSAFGTLNIVNEGGMPVDEAYQELRSMAPELFPELTHPADQLKRMFEMGRSIRKAEHTLEQYHNCHSRNFNPCSPWRERGGLQYRHSGCLQEPGRAGRTGHRLPERRAYLPGGGSPAEHHGGAWA